MDIISIYDYITNNKIISKEMYKCYKCINKLINVPIFSYNHINHKIIKHNYGNIYIFIIHFIHFYIHFL